MDLGVIGSVGHLYAPDLYWEAMALLTSWRPALTVLALAGCSIPVSKAAGSTVDCADWNSSKYFQVAGVEDVAACLASGADIKARDEDGRSPLHYAAWSNKKPAVITALLDAEADIEAREKGGQTPLHWAALFAEDPAVITALLDAGADIEARDSDGQTPLHKAVGSSYDHTAIPELLALGADPKARSEGGFTPLDLAALYNGNPAVIAALVAAGADIEARNEDGRTPLHLATLYNGPGIITAPCWRPEPIPTRGMRAALHLYIEQLRSAKSPLSSSPCWMPARIPTHETKPARRPGTTPRTTRRSRVPTPTGG